MNNTARRSFKSRTCQFCGRVFTTQQAESRGKVVTMDTRGRFARRSNLVVDHVPAWMLREYHEKRECESNPSLAR